MINDHSRCVIRMCEVGRKRPLRVTLGHRKKALLGFGGSGLSASREV